VPLQLENQWSEGGHQYVRWSDSSRAIIRGYKHRVQKQLCLSPRCGHVKGHGGVKGAVRFTRALTNCYRFVARFDIPYYYQSMDHQVMLGLLKDVSNDVVYVVQAYLCLPDRRCFVLK